MTMHNPRYIVTLNLVQGPSTLVKPTFGLTWMLKQVQHDEFFVEAAE